MKTTYVIGITGGIAGGKTAVSNILAQKGEYIIDADVISREIIKHGTIGEQLLLEAFPEAFNNGVLNREMLREIVFNDEKKLKTLNDITHPLIRKEIEKRIKKADCDQVYLVVPLMFESGFNKLCDYIVTIVADEDIRIERLMKRNNISKELAKKIINSQSSDDERIAHADSVIINNGDIACLQKEVNKFNEEVKKHRK